MFQRTAHLSGVILAALTVSHPVASTRTATDTGVPAAQQGDGNVVVERVGSYVRQYYEKARNLVSLERVTLQALNADLSPQGWPRRLEYELRVEWDPTATGDPANVVRLLLKVDGRPPKPKDEPGCMDPKSVSPEPLAMFLPEEMDDYVFRVAGRGRTDRRPAVMLDYKSIAQGPMQVTWREECVSIELPGRSVGRVWVTEDTGEVLRLDERLTGQFNVPVPVKQQRQGGAPSMTIERADTSIRYKPVRFHEPEETILMPAEIDSLTIVRDSGTPRMRTRQVFSNYRRFLTEGRIVP